MSHRAPDPGGTWASGPVALAYRAFRVTPESFYEQFPLVSGPLALVADARIDNREDLLRRLNERLRSLSGPSSERPVTDAELILAAYAEWGEEAPAELIGDFAFAVWDADRASLFCARDPFGPRPLYYAHDPGHGFVFGTETKAILAHEDVDGALDEVYVADRLVGNREDPQRTPYQGVRQLPSGHALTVSERGLDVRRYYVPRPDPTARGLSDEEVTARFLELLREAVRCRVRSAVPVGAHVSGGLDSSTVAVLARDLLGVPEASAAVPTGRLPTFSSVFADIPEADEREYVEVVHATGGFEPHLVEMGDIGPIGNLEEVYETVDGAVSDGMQHMEWAMMKEMRAAGVRLLLTGFDGDTTVDHGNTRLRELADAGDWETFEREARLMAERYAEASHRQRFEETIATASKSFTSYGLPALLDLAEQGSRRAFYRSLRGAMEHLKLQPRRFLRRVWRRLLAPRPLNRVFRRWRDRGSAGRSLPDHSFIDAEFADRIGIRGRLETSPFLQDALTFRSVRGDQQLKLQSAHLSNTLALYSHVAGAYGIETAHPFFDRRLIEFCLALPSHQSLRDGWTRHVLRRAVSTILPEAIAWRVGKASMARAYAVSLLDTDGDRLDAVINRDDWLHDYVDTERMDEVRRAGFDASGPEQTDLGSVASLMVMLRRYWPDGPRERHAKATSTAPDA